MLGRLLLSSSFLLPLASAWANPNVDVPKCPPEVSHVVDGQFANFAFELASLLNFIYTSPSDPTPNQYSLNLLNEVFKRTGGHPVIRVGGTSADYTTYRADQEEPVLPIPVVGNAQNNTGTTIGPNFWPLTKAWASLNSTWVPELSIANNDLDPVRALAKAAVDGVGMEHIEQLEPGNEPNLYPLTELGPPNWVGKLDNQGYADRFKQYVSVISEAISLPDDFGPYYSACNLAANVSGIYDYPMNVYDIFKSGINDENIVKSVAAHFYQITGGSIQDLLNHTSVVTHMAVQKGWTEYLAGMGIPLIMDEVNVLTGQTNETLVSSLASAVYRVDYFLYCMTIGIKRVSMESVFGSNQSVWQAFESNGSPAQTRGAYYSYLPTADFIGNTGDNTNVAQINVDGATDGARFIAYAAYDNQTLNRIALINFNDWSQVQYQEPRGTTNVTLTGLSDTKTITVKYLTHPEGGAGLASGITYGGSQWTFASLGLEQPGGNDDTITLEVSDGQAHVSVPYTSVAIVFVGEDS